MKRIDILPILGLLIILFASGCDEVNTNRAAAGTGNSTAGQAATAKQQESDMGKAPWVVDIEEATLNNSNYRHVRWTGEHLQMVLMSLKPGEEIELELHDGVDQFIRIEQGEAQVRMGKTKENLSFDKKVSDDWAIFIPAGYWHHIKNTGSSELKLYSIYAPSQHPAGTLHKTVEEASKHHDDHD